MDNGYLPYLYNGKKFHILPNGINETARKIWMGHSLGALGKAYTELSDEFFLQEAQKFYFFEKF